METAEIEEAYQERRNEIQERLEEFQKLRDEGDPRLFRELVFVILTSRSAAKKSWEAAEKLEELGLLENGSRKEIAEVLENHGIQYERDKAGYIVSNRESLSQPTLRDTSGELKLSSRIDPGNLEKTREQLVDSLQGVGWKGASHFLRNIGYGGDFAITSAYIMNNLHQLEMVESPEPPSGKEEYLKFEREFRKLSQQLGIGVQELDLLLWSMETGEVFR